MKTRISRVKRLLPQDGVAGYLVEDPLDLYYLTGLSLSAGVLLITRSSCTLFVDGRYQERAKRALKSAVLPIEALHKEAQRVGRVAFDSSSTSYARYLELKRWGWRLKGIPGLLQRIRVVKEREEIARIQASCRLTLEAIAHVEKLLKPGVTEREVALAFEIYALEQGAERVAFAPIVAFGTNSAYPHHRAGETRLKPSDAVLIDGGVVKEGYCSDFTRMFFPARGCALLKELYGVVRRAQQAALALSRPGTRLAELDQAARQVVVEAGREALLVHSLGHGLGLSVHEFPRISDRAKESTMPLEEGMAITIEPGLYLPGKGGVRYEDTVIITRKGYAAAL